MPNARTSPSLFRSSTARCQRSSSAHASVQTWNCCRSIASTPRFSQAVLGVLADVIGRKHVVERVLGPRRPLAVLRRDLGRDVQLLVRVPLQQLAEQLLALALAVGPGRVEEIATELDRAVERLRSDSSSSDPVHPPMPHMP